MKENGISLGKNYNKTTQTHVVFTERADGVLALIHLFSHHPADRHQTLRDVATGFH